MPARSPRTRTTRTPNQGCDRDRSKGQCVDLEAQRGSTVTHSAVHARTLRANGLPHAADPPGSSASGNRRRPDPRPTTSSEANPRADAQKPEAETRTRLAPSCADEPITAETRRALRKITEPQVSGSSPSPPGTPLLRFGNASGVGPAARTSSAPPAPPSRLPAGELGCDRAPRSRRFSTASRLTARTR